MRTLRLIRSDAPAPTPVAYPPPSNAVIGQSRAPNPYAQQNVGAAPGGGNYNAYAAQPQQTSYNNTAYGQEQGYAQGGYGGAAPTNGVGAGGDFWSELSATNGNLSQLQEEIQAVRSAHQQSLVSDTGTRRMGLIIDIHRSWCFGTCGPAQRASPSYSRTVQKPN